MQLADRQSGFTLLEALVSVVVVSLGLLGILGMQAIGLANTHQSLERATAAIATQNITERMRANPVGFANGDYDGIAHPAAGQAPTDCSAQSCSPAQMAAFDAYQWDVRLGNILPSGRGRITCNDSPCTAQSPRTVTVIWRESDRVLDQGGSSDKCAALDANGDDVTDRCFQTVFRP